jgi:DNA-binding HxlR family transcriptional regulator
MPPFTATSDELSHHWLERHVASLAEANGCRLELLVRALNPPAGARKSQDRVLRRLESLPERGIVDSYEIRVCGARIPPEGTAARTDAGRRLNDIVDRARSWADDHDPVTLEGTFAERTVDCSITGEHYRVVVPPCLALFVYRGDDLSAVVPCSVGDRALSVAGYLDLLADEITDSPRSVAIDG